MGVKARLVLFVTDSALAGLAAGAAFDRIARLDSLLSDYRPASELNSINRSAGDRAVRVSGDTYRVLDRALALARETGGAFDPTVGPLVLPWRESRRTGALPDPAVLADARSAVGWEHVSLDRAQHAVRLGRPGMRLDLGAIAKGFACDEALTVLERYGVSRALIELGGDIAAADAPPGTDGWSIEIPGEGRIELHNRAIASSGDAEQAVVIDGVRYSHVVDPRTGLGLTGGIQATVIADEAAAADAWATAITVMKPEERTAFLRAHPALRVWLRDGADERSR